MSIRGRISFPCVISETHHISCLFFCFLTSWVYCNLTIKGEMPILPIERFVVVANTLVGIVGNTITRFLSGDDIGSRHRSVVS